MKILTILVDIDEVLNNLLECWVAYLNKEHGTKVITDNIRTWDLSNAFPTLTKNEIYSPLYKDELWTHITPKPDSVKYLGKMINDGHKVLIVTASVYQTLPIKMNWLFSDFPYLTWDDVIVTSQKQLIKGDVLIDDGIHNLEGSDYFKILIDSPYNRDYDVIKNNMVRAYTLKDAYREINKLAQELCPNYNDNSGWKYCLYCKNGYEDNGALYCNVRGNGKFEFE